MPAPPNSTRSTPLKKRQIPFISSQKFQFEFFNEILDLPPTQSLNNDSTDLDIQSQSQKVQSQSQIIQSQSCSMTKKILIEREEADSTQPSLFASPVEDQEVPNECSLMLESPVENLVLSGGSNKG